MNGPVSRTIEVDNMPMRVMEQGSGPLVLLCHGFPETAHAWRHQLAGLAAAGYHAVAPNLRGMGGSWGPAEVERYTTFDLVSDMVGLLDALGAETAVIVGNDWGATIAWQAALLRPDRFRAVAACGVPMMGRPPVAPTNLFPRTPDALSYILWFQEPGVAEAEFERDPRLTLRRILCAASGEAGPRLPGDGTPNPFGMVVPAEGLLQPLPDPDRLPPWLTEADLDLDADAFGRSGFRGALNLYRNLDRNWMLQRALAGARVTVPALFVAGERDPGMSMPGMDRIVGDMPALVPGLRRTMILPACGHWVPQERPDEVTSALIEFMAAL